MYEDGQLEHELKQFKKVTKLLNEANVALSTVKTANSRTRLVTLMADVQLELSRREEMMHQYKTTGEF